MKLATLFLVTLVIAALFVGVFSQDHVKDRRPTLRPTTATPTRPRPTATKPTHASMSTKPGHKKLEENKGRVMDNKWCDIHCKGAGWDFGHCEERDQINPKGYCAPWGMQCICRR